jgi:hypothetical protein
VQVTNIKLNLISLSVTVQLDPSTIALSPGVGPEIDQAEVKPTLAAPPTAKSSESSTPTAPGPVTRPTVSPVEASSDSNKSNDTISTVTTLVALSSASGSQKLDIVKSTSTQVTAPKTVDSKISTSSSPRVSLRPRIEDGYI